MAPEAALHLLNPPQALIVLPPARLSAGLLFGRKRLALGNALAGHADGLAYAFEHALTPLVVA